MSELPNDVVRLVIAARVVAYENQDADALRELDLAAESFASRVPWDNAPEGLEVWFGPAWKMLTEEEFRNTRLQGPCAIERIDGVLHVWNADQLAGGLNPKAPSHE